MPDGGTPLRGVVVGAGGMGRGWLRTVDRSDRAELAAVVDLDIARATEATAELSTPDVSVLGSVDEALATVKPDFLVDVTVPAAHHAITLAALRAGVPVLGEKPAAATLAETVQLAAASECYGVPFVVSQNRRFEPHADQVLAAVEQVGRPELVSVLFSKAIHFGGFRDEMDHPLLLDMSIHHLDYLRYVMGEDPVVDVLCDEYNESWSWYAGDASATLLMRFASGARATYVGSWSSPGLQTSWNADWRFTGQHGTVHWDGDNAPEVGLADGEPAELPEASDHNGLPASFDAFLDGLTGGPQPTTPISDNLRSVALVFAAFASSASGKRVAVADVLEQARDEAARAADDPDLAAAVRALELG
jgi:predicted dehydrogenase